MNILVFCPNLVGDTVMATPAFRALRTGYPDSRIVAVIKPKVAPTLDGSPWFDDRIGFDPRSSRADERFMAVLPRLRAERAELAHTLLLSLEPGDFDEDADQEWAAEIRRRLQAIRNGRVALRDWDEALVSIRQAITTRGKG